MSVQSLERGFLESASMTQVAVEWASEWQERLVLDCPTQSEATRQSIVQWLLGERPERLDNLDERQQAIAQQAMRYRYRILQERYLGVGPNQSYRNLIQRLGSLALLRNKIRTWVSLSRDRRCTVADTIQEVLQEMLQSDRHLRRELRWIEQCTEEPRLRNAFLLTSLEEYCLRPIRNQPLLVHRFVNYLRRAQRSGLTKVPQQERIRTLSDELSLDEGSTPISLFDTEATSRYEEQEALAAQQHLRVTVQREFEAYLAASLDELAVQWLRLYLQGYTQEMIARELGVPIKQIYRLREKVSYHAIRVFALKGQPELVANWLQASLQEHSLGLTPSQWQDFWANLTPLQQRIIEQFKLGHPPEVVARTLQLKPSQVMAEWGKVYQEAQARRSA